MHQAGRDIVATLSVRAELRLAPFVLFPSAERIVVQADTLWAEGALLCLIVCFLVNIMLFMAHPMYRDTMPVMGALGCVQMLHDGCITIL